MKSDGSKTKKFKGLYIRPEILNSRAFNELKCSGNALYLYICFLKKRVMVKIPVGKKKEWTCTNINKITFYYSEAKKLGFSSQGFNNAIDRLVDLGFIDIVHAGIGRARIATIFALSDRYKRYGENDFQKIARKKMVSYRPEKFNKSKK